MEEVVTSLIPESNTIAIWAVIIGVVCVANLLDQRFKWANKISIVVMCIVSGMLLGNLHIMPYSSSVYNGISKVLLYLAIPMLLFKSNVRKLVREGGRVFGAFHIASIATVIAAIIYGFALKFFDIPNLAGLVGATAGGSIGGTVNIVAVSGVFELDETMLSAITLLANANLGIMLAILGFMCNSKFFRKKMKHPYIEAREAEILADPAAKDRPLSAAFWKCKELSLLDILKTFATAFVIVALSQGIANWVKSLNPPFIIQQMFGSIYMIMTLLTVLGATLLPKWFSSLKFGDEFGMIILTMWYVTIGLTADIAKILSYVLIILFIFVITMLVHVLVAFPIGRKLGLSLEEMCCATSASIGGPSSSVALTINHGWRDLIAPSIVCALWGYVIGNYLGVLVGNIFL